MVAAGVGKYANVYISFGGVMLTLEVFIYVMATCVFEFALQPTTESPGVCDGLLQLMTLKFVALFEELKVMLEGKVKTCSDVFPAVTAVALETKA